MEHHAKTSDFERVYITILAHVIGVSHEPKGIPKAEKKRAQSHASAS
jgi:hypothetical protein